MNMRLILDYLTGLEGHNEREWYHAHKREYQEANAAFEELVQELMHALRETDETILLCEPKELTFKLVRDTRFSHDKSPYNPSFRAHISGKGKLPVPVGYYIMLKPGGRSFLGGGLFADMFKDATAMVRNHIAAHGARWQEIVSDPGFTECFTVGGTTLKNVPRGYDANHPQAEALKMKSWYLEYPVSDEKLLEPDFLEEAVKIFQKMQPFNRFLNEGLKEFQMPAR